jgi:hypothetical protein
MGRLLMVLLRSKGKEVEKGAFVFWIFGFFFCCIRRGRFVILCCFCCTTRYDTIPFNLFDVVVFVFPFGRFFWRGPVVCEKD